MRTIYGRRDQLLREMGIKDPTAVQQEMALIRLEDASEWAQQFCKRSFHATIGTLYTAARRRGSRSLLLRDDWLSISEIRIDDDDDGDYDLTLVEGTDYYLEPNDETRKWRIDLLGRTGALIWSWPTSPRSIKITGTRGYSNDSVATGVTLAGNISANATSLTLSGSTDQVADGDVILIGSEKFYVERAEATAVTVEPAVLGTTAAGHTSGDAIRRIVYPAALVTAVHFEAARMMREVKGAGAQRAGGQDAWADGGFVQTFPVIMKRLEGLIRPEFV